MSAEPSQAKQGYPKSVASILVLKKASAGAAQPERVEVLSRPKRKKVSRALRPVDRELRALAYAARTYFDSYDERHTRSLERKKDGAIKQFGKNSSRARRDAAKELRRHSKLFKRLGFPRVIRRIF